MRQLVHNGQLGEQRWPDEAQRLLLQAALGAPDVARAAWEEWYRTTDIEALDYSAHRIFPLLYRNLVALGIDSPDLPRLKGVYRHYWYSNQLLLADAKLALRTLGDRGIETLVLKGLALTAAHYGDGGTRPMDDIDILVHPGDARRAFDALREIGYAPLLTGPLELHMKTLHALGMGNRAGRDLDLHWYSLFQSVGDEDLWSASLPLTVAGVQTRALCPSDQLLHVCVHGVSGYAPAPLRWVADAVTVIRTSEERLDWDRLVGRASARGCSLALLDALVDLDRFVSVPGTVIERLRAAPSSRAERLAHRAAVHPYTHGSFYAFEWDRYRRLRAARAPDVQPNFAAYLRDRWNLDSYRQLAWVLARKGWQVARRGRSAPGNRGEVLAA